MSLNVSSRRLRISIRLSRCVRKPAFAYAKTKTQISFAVNEKLISAFVFATPIVQSLYFLNPTFPVSSYLLWSYSPVCVRPGRKPRRPVFSQRGSYRLHIQNFKLMAVVCVGVHAGLCLTCMIRISKAYLKNNEITT